MVFSEQNNYTARQLNIIRLRLARKHCREGQLIPKIKRLSGRNHFAAHFNVDPFYTDNFYNQARYTHSNGRCLILRYRRYRQC